MEAMHGRPDGRPDRKNLVREESPNTVRRQRRKHGQPLTAAGSKRTDFSLGKREKILSPKPRESATENTPPEPFGEDRFGGQVRLKSCGKSARETAVRAALW